MNDLKQLRRLLDELDLSPVERDRAEQIVGADGADVEQALTALFGLAGGIDLSPVERARLERIRSFVKKL